MERQRNISATSTMAVMRAALTAFFESSWACAPSNEERWGIMEIIVFLGGRAASSEEAFRDGIAGLLMQAGVWHAEGLISDGTYRAFQRLQRQDALLRALLERLPLGLDRPVGLPVPPSGGADEPSTQEGLPAWRVQPEESTEIQYQAFEVTYGCTHPQIDALIALLWHFHPGTPVLNRTVEWAVRNLREMEGLNMAAGI